MPGKGPTKRVIAHRLREMARGAVNPDFAAGLNAAADMLDDREGATVHTCELPRHGHHFMCPTCRIKWYGFHTPHPNGMTTVEWVTIDGLKARAS